ncbi:hypothetical protein LPJ56_001210 [Coemansia sp. RSA 2599]|nr:hypothetical protein LPJ75_000794 [Coemansia sp. RSA 2598]KAJ1828268.1 hypothetical protein LPJ56_001210 [Coemansia sp. RSA 2599]
MLSPHAHSTTKSLLLLFLTCIALCSTTTAARGGNQVLIVTAARDSSVVQSTDKTDSCYGQSQTSLGTQKTLVADSNAKRKTRILLGFDMPKSVKSPSLITNCTLVVPVPKVSPESDYSLTAYVAGSQWSERTVNCSTALQIKQELGSISIKKNDMPGDIDVTKACQKASDGGV